VIRPSDQPSVLQPCDFRNEGALFRGLHDFSIVELAAFALFHSELRLKYFSFMRLLGLVVDVFLQTFASCFLVSRRSTPQHRVLVLCLGGDVAHIGAANGLVESVHPVLQIRRRISLTEQCLELISRRERRPAPRSMLVVAKPRL